MRDVTIAGRANGKVFLAGGIEPGEKVIVDTLTKLRPGDTVRTRGGPGKPGNAPRTAAAPAPGTGG
jgi:multidrug efflux system membrane fusion protein